MATRRTTRSHIGPDEPRDPYAAEGTAPPPQTAGEALARARQHGRAAAAEALAAVRALIDAASLAVDGQPSEANRLLGPVAKLLEAVGNELGDGADARSSRMLDSITAAIDDEISLWEERARDDTEARTVLRAFLGLREILWEFGVRRSDGAAEAGPAEPPSKTTPSRRPAPRPGPRIQRVPVQG
jgi:hypothetical protein